MEQGKRILHRTPAAGRAAVAATASAEQATAGLGLRVRRILPGEPLGDVPRLRREVYFHEQGQFGDRSKRVADGLDGCGTTVLVEKDAYAIATLRLHDFSSPAVQVEYGSLFQVDAFARAWPLPKVAVGTRFAVQADQRSKIVVDKLLEEAYRWAQESRVHFCLLACEPFLHGVFEHYGFREYLPPAILPGGVDLLRMALVVEDEPHLSECGSPLHRLVREPARAVAAKAWLARTFQAME
ncbi:N-acyl amino acid synthase FeeM domain-containing protein [Pseudoxanthomonas putridarboris]|uniref:N-acyl amino acid synthase FeeM catalytic core domain-containing protein n=1 Tax=Pseudoxanthomonas putridarboris TaxID=752605 RepID=A0ABU9J3L0_9GAMM